MFGYFRKKQLIKSEKERLFDTSFAIKDKNILSYDALEDKNAINYFLNRPVKKHLKKMIKVLSY